MSLQYYMDTMPRYSDDELLGFKLWYESEQLPKDLEIFKARKRTNYFYFLTFTWNNSVDKTLFKQAVEKQLTRSIILTGRYSFEHEDTNIHCHAYVQTNHRLSKANFASHSRKYGFVDIKRVTKDNGVNSYMSKENETKEIKNIC